MKTYPIGGHNNSCGLYSLSLGTALALRESGQPRPAQIPDFITEIKPSDVITLEGQVALNQKLRPLLAVALRNNVAFERVSKINFARMIQDGW